MHPADHELQPATEGLLLKDHVQVQPVGAELQVRNEEKKQRFFHAAQMPRAGKERTLHTTIRWFHAMGRFITHGPSPSLVCFPPPPPPISRHRGPSLFSPFPFSTIRVLLLGVPCLFMQTLGSGRNDGRRCERARRGERRVLSYFLPFLRTVGDKMKECGGGFAQFFISR